MLLLSSLKFEVGNCNTDALLLPTYIRLDSTYFFIIFFIFVFQLEICADDEVLEASSCKNTTQVASSIGGPAVEVSERNKVSLAEELDNLMDISIEIASNKRMKKDHLKSFRLTFIDKDIQKKVRFFPPYHFSSFFYLHISLEMKS